MRRRSFLSMSPVAVSLVLGPHRVAYFFLNGLWRPEEGLDSILKSFRISPYEIWTQWGGRYLSQEAFIRLAKNERVMKAVPELGELLRLAGENQRRAEIGG